MSKKQTSFVTKVDLSIADALLAGLKNQGFEISQPAYTLFSGKKKGVSCTLYASGKLLVQGKEMPSFIEFYLEPEILKEFSFTLGQIGQTAQTTLSTSADTTRRIGIDESGKGDFFGPLCIAGVCAGGETIGMLEKLGVCDSKKVNDKKVVKLAREIKKSCPHHIVRINPVKYNELYSKFGNLNSLLAWGHATAIEALVTETDCHKVIVDQFANERVVETALRRKKLEVDLHQRHRAEEDIVVAAASILARDAFLQGLEKLSKQYINLPKGASSQVIAAGRAFVREFGREQLGQVAKLHFKTTQTVLS